MPEKDETRKAEKPLSAWMRSMFRALFRKGQQVLNMTFTYLASREGTHFTTSSQVLLRQTVSVTSLFPQLLLGVPGKLL